MLLLDTNIIVDILRGRELKQQSLFYTNKLFISVISMAELFTGAYKSLRPKSNTNKLGEVIRELEIETIDINSSIIEDYAKTRAALEKSGVRIDNFDLLIAATATTYKLPLLTNNTKHFNHIPFLKLI